MFVVMIVIANGRPELMMAVLAGRHLEPAVVRRPRAIAGQEPLVHSIRSVAGAGTCGGTVITGGRFVRKMRG